MDRARSVRFPKSTPISPTSSVYTSLHIFPDQSELIYARFELSTWSKDTLVDGGVWGYFIGTL